MTDYVEENMATTAFGFWLFKAVRPDGTDFDTGAAQWLPANGEPIPEGGWLVEHPNPGKVGGVDEAFYLSASTVPTNCPNFSWPGRLLLVEPVGAMWNPQPYSLPCKRAANAWRVIKELPAWKLFGPQGREIETLLGQVESLAKDDPLKMSAAWDAAIWDAARGASWSTIQSVVRNAVRGSSRGAAQAAIRNAIWDAARGGAWSGIWNAAWSAARGLLVLDLEPTTAEILMATWVSVMGRSWE